MRLARDAWRVFDSFSGGEFRSVPERVDDRTLAVTAGEVVGKSLALVAVNELFRIGTDHHGLWDDSKRAADDRGEFVFEHPRGSLHVPPVGDKMDAVEPIEAPLQDLPGDRVCVRERAVPRIKSRNDGSDSCLPGSVMEPPDLVAFERVSGDEEWELEISDDSDGVVDPTGRRLVTLVMRAAEHNDSSSGHVSSRM